MDQQELKIVSSVFAKVGTVVLIPRQLFCPTCGCKIPIVNFLIHEVVECGQEHKHERIDFGKQFGIITGID